MPDKDTTALRKRAQIAKANRVMFVWVACASVVVSASVVVVTAMAQKGIHNQEAISKLHGTVKTLQNNNDSVDELKNAIRALGSNERLLHLRTNESDNALRVILDALPADANPAALGASLQTKLFPPELEVDSINITPMGGVIGGDDQADAGAGGVIDFRFTVHGDAEQLKLLLERFEKSIRTIQLSQVTIESNGSRQTLTVSGQAYYEPAKTLELKNESV